MDPREELERAARKHRDKVSATDDKAARDDHKNEARRAKVRAAMRKEALAGGAGNRILNISILLGLVVPVGLCVWLLDGVSYQVVISVAATVGGVIVAVVLAMLAEAALARMHLDKLRARAPGLDLVRYQDQLSEKWRGASVKLQLQFARAWPDADRSKLDDALKTWLPKTQATEWRGSTLEIASERLETTEYLSGGTVSGGRNFNNRWLHDWTAKAILRVVPKLAAIAPVAGVAVDIVGSKEDWDAEA